MVHLHYHERGKGKTVVFIHGFCETHKIWDHFVDELSKQFHTVAIDLPGFGESKSPMEGFTISDIGEQVSDWIVRQGIDKPVVIGHSLGGYVTLAMVEKSPTFFSGFGLFHSTAFADDEAKKESRLKVIDFVGKHGIETYMETFIPGLFFQKTNASIPAVVNLAKQTSFQTFKSYSLAMRSRPDRTKVLSLSQVPVLILAGDNDAGIPVEHLERQAEVNSRVEMHVLENTGHMGMFESEKACERYILDFVRGVFR